MPTRKPTTGGPKDNITTWIDDQPVVQLEYDEDAEPGDVFPEAPGQPATPGPREERPPHIPSRTENLFNRVRGAAKSATKRAPKPATPPKAKQPRKPVADLVTAAWGMFAQVASGINPPVARVLQLQGPVAGMMLEDTIKDTVLDRILQPIARTEGKGEVAFALIAPPVLVAVANARPDLAPAIKPVLRQALKIWIKTAGPHLEKLQQEESDFEAKYGMQLELMMYYIMTGETLDKPPADFTFVPDNTPHPAPGPGEQVPHSDNGGGAPGARSVVDQGAIVFRGPAG